MKHLLALVLTACAAPHAAPTIEPSCAGRVGEFPADFAVLTSVLDSKLDLVDAVSTPRIGFFDVAADLGSTQFNGLPPIAVDPRIPRADLCALSARGWPLNARADVYNAHLGYVDAVSIAPGRLRGVPAERLGGVAVGY